MPSGGIRVNKTKCGRTLTGTNIDEKEIFLPSIFQKCLSHIGDTLYFTLIIVFRLFIAMFPPKVFWEIGIHLFKLNLWNVELSSYKHMMLFWENIRSDDSILWYTIFCAKLSHGDGKVAILPRLCEGHCFHEPYVWFLIESLQTF